MHQPSSRLLYLFLIGCIFALIIITQTFSGNGDTNRIPEEPVESHVKSVQNSVDSHFKSRINSITVSESSVSAENSSLRELYANLDDLDVTIGKLSPESKIYGNIYSKKGLMQVQSYTKVIKEFSKLHPINTICEIGFAGGHSATVFLSATDSASYTGFDVFDRPAYENAAFEWVKNKFSGRNIKLIKGDSTKTIPQYEGTCDLIHIDGAHHAHYPITDMKNMARLASKNNLLLMDDCSESFPAVVKGIKYITENQLVTHIDMFIAKGWVHRGFQKGWCIGSYKK